MATKYTAYWRWEDTSGVHYEVINYGNRNIGNLPAQTEHGLLMGETVEGLRKERDEWRAKAEAERDLHDITVKHAKAQHAKAQASDAQWNVLVEFWQKKAKATEHLADTCGTLQATIEMQERQLHQQAMYIARLESFIGPTGMKRIEKLEGKK